MQLCIQFELQYNAIAIYNIPLDEFSRRYLAGQPPGVEEALKPRSRSRGRDGKWGGKLGAGLLGGGPASPGCLSIRRYSHSRLSEAQPGSVLPSACDEPVFAEDITMLSPNM